MPESTPSNSISGKNPRDYRRSKLNQIIQSVFSYEEMFYLKELGNNWAIYGFYLAPKVPGKV